MINAINKIVLAYRYQLNKALKISYLLYRISASTLFFVNITSEPYLFWVFVIANKISSAPLYSPDFLPSFKKYKYVLNPVFIKFEYSESVRTTSNLFSLGEIHSLFSSFGIGKILSVVP